MVERLRTLDFWTGLLLAVAVFAAVFDPTGTVLPYVKYGAVLLFALLSLLAGWRTGFVALRQYDARKLALYVAVFAVVLPVYATAVHFVRGDYPEGPWSMYAGTFVFLVLLVGGGAVSGSARRVEMAVVLALTSLAFFIWIMPLLDVFMAREDVNNIGYVLQIWSYQFRQYGSVQMPYLYYYTSPMLVVPVAYWGFRALRAKKKRSVEFAVACVCLAALFLSGTRANMVVAIALAAYFLWQISRPVFAVVIPLMTFLAFRGRQTLGQMVAVEPSDGDPGGGGGGGVSDAAALTAQSNARKLEYLHTYADLFSDPVAFVFGYGTGSCMPRADVTGCVPVTELTYLDTIRFFGIIGALVYAFLFFYPLWRHMSRSHYLLSGWLAYLVIATVNPYIFSTNGMTVLAAVLLGAMTIPARRSAPWTFGEARAEVVSGAMPVGRGNLGAVDVRADDGSARSG
jgi:hypothetical protein